MEFKAEDMVKQAYILHFDIPSEGFKFLYDTSKDEDSIKLIKAAAKNKIATCRLISSRQLHVLGLASSESVLLIPASTTDETIDTAIKTVEENYRAINDLLVGFNLPSIGMPFIRKVPIVKFQFTMFKEM